MRGPTQSDYAPTLRLSHPYFDYVQRPFDLAEKKPGRGGGGGGRGGLADSGHLCGMRPSPAARRCPCCVTRWAIWRHVAFSGSRSERLCTGIT